MFRFQRLLLAALSCCVVLSSSWAQPASNESNLTDKQAVVQGLLKDMGGTVEAYRASSKEWTEAIKGSTFQERDALSTDRKSWAQVEFHGRHLVKMQENTEMTILQLSKKIDTGEENTVLDLSAGEILNRVQKLPTEGSIYTIHTPTATSSVRGTVWSVEVYKRRGKPRTRVRVLEGVVDVVDEAGKILELTDGEETEISELGVPDSPRKMSGRTKRKMQGEADTTAQPEAEGEAPSLEMEAESLEQNVETIIEGIESTVEKPINENDEDDDDGTFNR